MNNSLSLKNCSSNERFMNPETLELEGDIFDGFWYFIKEEGAWFFEFVNHPMSSTFILSNLFENTRIANMENIHPEDYKLCVNNMTVQWLKSLEKGKYKQVYGLGIKRVR